MVEGDIETGSLMAGQCAAMVEEVLPAAEIVRRMATEAEAILTSFNGRGRS